MPFGRHPPEPGLLAALRARLAHVGNLAELIADPPAILIDERQ